MTDVRRITLTPREVDAREVVSIVSLVQLGRIPEAWQQFQAACLTDGAMARLGGVVNAALAQSAPEFELVPVAANYGSQAPYFVSDWGRAFGVNVGIALFAAAPGLIQVVGEDGYRVELCISDAPGKFLDTRDETVRALSSGTTERLSIPAGMWASGRYVPGMQPASRHLKFDFHFPAL